MNLIRLSLAAAGLALLAGCASLPSAGDCPRLPGGGYYCLQSSSGMTKFDALQAVDIEFDGKRETFIVSLEVDGGGMRFAGLTPFGQKLLAANYDNRDVRVESLAPLSDRLDPKLVAALLQLALWPAERVRVGLAAELEFKDDGHRRVIVQHGAALLRIDYEGETAPYRHIAIDAPAARLHLDIKTMPGEDGERNIR